MLDFGFSEILLTSAIALVVLGPERLPKVARQVGNWMGRARVMARQLTEQLEREVSAEELMREQSKPQASAENRIASPQAPPPQATPPQYGVSDAHTPPDAHAAMPGGPQAAPPDPVKDLDPHSSPSGLDSKPPNE
jgi:sec-independent protein translocase protein TatB